MYNVILVATDGSEGGQAAVEHAITLAAAVDADLNVVSVLETRTGYDNAIVDPERVDRERRADAEARLADIDERAKSAGLSVRSTLRSGVPHEEIQAEATDRGADVLVLGAEGRSALRGALLGSTVDRLVRTADRPVLVVGG